MSVDLSDLLEPLLGLIEDPGVREGVEETARLFFQSSTATVNLIPSFIIGTLLLIGLLSALGIPILSSLGLNLTGAGSTSGGYGVTGECPLTGQLVDDKTENCPLAASGYARGDFDTQVSS